MREKLKSRPKPSVAERLADLSTAQLGETADFRLSNLIPRHVNATTKLGEWAVEFLLRSSVIDRDEMEEALQTVESLGSGFDRLSEEEKEAREKYLGSLVRGNLEIMNSTVDGFSGSIYEYPLKEFGKFMGFVIGNSVVVREISLPDTS